MNVAVTETEVEEEKTTNQSNLMAAMGMKC